MTSAIDLHDESASGVKAQSVLLTVLGRYVLGRDVLVGTSSILDVLTSVASASMPLARRSTGWSSAVY